VCRLREGLQHFQQSGKTPANPQVKLNLT
jgi:hypothetical protein